MSTFPIVTDPESVATNWISREFEPHWIHPGDSVIPGVTFRGLPPLAGSTKISPAGIPSSLMSPPMKAMEEPFGDHSGTATCMDGVSNLVIFPSEISIRQ